MSKSENCTKILNLNQLLNEWIRINVTQTSHINFNYVP